MRVELCDSLLIFWWRVRFQRWILENNRIKSIIDFTLSPGNKLKSLTNTLISNHIMEDKSKKNLNLLSLPTYRIFPSIQQERPRYPFPRLALMPHPPLLAMQLMMLRIRNSTPFAHHHHRPFSSNTIYSSGKHTTMFVIVHFQTLYYCLNVYVLWMILMHYIFTQTSVLSTVCNQATKLHIPIEVIIIGTLTFYNPQCLRIQRIQTRRMIKLPLLKMEMLVHRKKILPVKTKATL